MLLSNLRVVFMGTPDFAVPALHSLVEAGAIIAGVFCQPARPAQRGHKIQKCAVHLAAERENLPVYTPAKLADSGVWEIYEALKPDITVVAAYGALLSDQYLSYPRWGCVNVHASLLPRWRGASPIQSAICAGDAESGITIMNMVKKLDAGAILSQQSCRIKPSTTAQSLHDELAQMGGGLLVETLAKLIAHQIAPHVQDESQVTYAPKLTKAMGCMQWRKTATELERQVRGYYPWPGSWFVYQGEIIKVLQAKVTDAQGPAGAVLNSELLIACGEGALDLQILQREGKKPLDKQEFLKGFRIPQGAMLSDAL